MEPKVCRFSPVIFHIDHNVCVPWEVYHKINNKYNKWRIAVEHIALSHFCFVQCGGLFLLIWCFELEAIRQGLDTVYIFVFIYSKEKGRLMSYLLTGLCGGSDFQALAKNVYQRSAVFQNSEIRQTVLHIFPQTTTLRASLHVSRYFLKIDIILCVFLF